MEEEEDADIGARMSLRGERKYNEMYVFIYTCSWARVFFICIVWHIGEKSKIAMTNFRIHE
jgi:hypothetical protein